MSRARTLAVLLFIALFIVLPLYEFADIGEHWPHDGEIVQVVLFGLFIAGLSLLCRGVACAHLGLKRSRILRPHPARVHTRSLVASLDRPSLFLVFCDLRV